jgi:hypothetical protein
VLGVPPQTFLDWKLESMAKGLSDPYGELEDWVIGGAIEWDTPAEAEAARQRYAEWLRGKGLSPERIARRLRPLTDEQIDRVAGQLVA